MIKLMRILRECLINIITENLSLMNIMSEDIKFNHYN
jgi:hypothetical protein